MGSPTDGDNVTTWPNEIAGPTLDDVFDLKGDAEIAAYREFCDEMSLDPWLAASFRAWAAGAHRG